jgi:hypothetical protein
MPWKETLGPWHLPVSLLPRCLEVSKLSLPRDPTMIDCAVTGLKQQGQVTMDWSP